MIVALFTIVFSLGIITLSVKVWHPVVNEQLEKYNFEECTPVALVNLTQESRGINLDVVQSSESIWLPPNTIKSSLRSIKTGIDYF